MAEPQPPRQGGNVLTRKLGPLPTWGWVVLAAAIVIGLAWWKSRQSQSQADTSTSGQVPQFVNQTYTTIQPPSAEPPEDDDDKHRRRHPRHKRGHLVSGNLPGGGPGPGPGVQQPQPVVTRFGTLPPPVEPTPTLSPGG